MNFPNAEFFFFFCETAAAFPQVCGANSKLYTADLSNLFSLGFLWFVVGGSQRHLFKVENGKQLEERFEGNKRLFLQVLGGVVGHQLVVLGDVAAQAAVVVSVGALALETEDSADFSNLEIDRLVGGGNSAPVEPGGPLASENWIVAANRVEGVVALLLPHL